ncbi:unnamed protein product, partial [Iphiclides podalirius]
MQNDVIVPIPLPAETSKPADPRPLWGVSNRRRCGRRRRNNPKRRAPRPNINAPVGRRVDPRAIYFGSALRFDAPGTPPCRRSFLPVSAPTGAPLRGVHAKCSECGLLVFCLPPAGGQIRRILAPARGLARVGPREAKPATCIGRQVSCMPVRIVNYLRFNLHSKQ